MHSMDTARGSWKISFQEGPHVSCMLGYDKAPTSMEHECFRRGPHVTCMLRYSETHFKHQYRIVLLMSLMPTHKRSPHSGLLSKGNCIWLPTSACDEDLGRGPQSRSLSAMEGLGRGPRSRCLPAHGIEDITWKNSWRIVFAPCAC